MEHSEFHIGLEFWCGSVFDEYDIEGCSLEREDDADVVLAGKHKEAADHG